MDNLTPENLDGVYKRLKKTTNNFSKLLVRDVFDYVDFQINFVKNVSELIYKIRSNKYIPNKPVIHESPKSKGICRPTAVLNIEDSIVYRYCIEQIQEDLLEITKQKNIRGSHRITAIRTPSGDTFYESWFPDWQAHIESIIKDLKKKNFAVTTDVASYFENVNLLLLKDLIRSDIKGKKEILNLLFYFLEQTHVRNNYEVNTMNGLLQEDIDCSRALAYYFLKTHDDRMGELCKKLNAGFYRYVDDMTIVVDSETQARRVLNLLAKSLRSLGLMSSVDKTQILNSSLALEEMFAEENILLNQMELQIIVSLKIRKDIREHSKIVDNLYKELYGTKSKYKDWIKILKRFYTIMTITQSDLLFDNIIEDLIKLPIAFVGPKVHKYFIRNKKSKKFYKAIDELIGYLYSDENLYQAIETNLIELLLIFDPSDYNSKNLANIKKLSLDIFFRTGYNPKSGYARALHAYSCINLTKQA